MRSFTDIFIKHPVLAVVVNLVIVLVGWRALTTLPVQQYPKIESSSIIITTVYYGAAAETVRGFLTTPIERVVSAISGVDYLESTSRAGVSTVTVHLKLNHNSTAALAEVTARLQQVRSELPAEAEPPAVEVQRADRPYASFYLSFTSPERTVPALTDWLLRTLQPQLATLTGVQRVTIEGGRQIAMRVWIDPDRLAAEILCRSQGGAAAHERVQHGRYRVVLGHGDAPRHQLQRLLRWVLLIHRPIRLNLGHAEHAHRTIKVRPSHLSLCCCPLVVLFLVPQQPAAGRGQVVVVASPHDRQTS